jgi:hypothetical protein
MDSCEEVLKKRQELDVDEDEQKMNMSILLTKCLM